MSNPLQIAIIGTGNIGSTFAYQLALAGGHAVTVIARPDSPRLRQLQRDGAIVRDDGTRAPVTVADRLDTATPYDLVSVTVPAQQVDTLIPALRDSAAARILFMVNQFDPERLRDAIGRPRCDFGMPFVQASLDANGRLHAVIGAGGQKRASLARSAGLTCSTLAVCLRSWSPTCCDGCAAMHPCASHSKQFRWQACAGEAAPAGVRR